MSNNNGTNKITKKLLILKLIKKYICSNIALIYASITREQYLINLNTTRTKYHFEKIYLFFHCLNWNVNFSHYSDSPFWILTFPVIHSFLMNDEKSFDIGVISTFRCWMDLFGVCWYYCTMLYRNITRPFFF